MNTTEKANRIRFFQKIEKQAQVFESELSLNYLNNQEKDLIKSVITSLSSLKQLGKNQ